MSKYLCQTRSGYLCVCLLVKRVCLYMHVAENVFYVDGGVASAGGGDQLCAGCRLLPVIGGGG